jgi:hypothetical protein
LSFRSIFVLKNAFDKNTPENGQINLNIGRIRQILCIMCFKEA